jgi:heme oxygenase
MTTKKTTTEPRTCKGSARFGIEPHEAPVAEFPEQPSRKDGLGTMCTEHWRAYVKGLREARKAAQAGEAATAGAPEADAA